MRIQRGRKNLPRRDKRCKFHAQILLDFLAEDGEAAVGGVEALGELGEFGGLGFFAELEVKVGEENVGVDDFGVLADGFLEGRDGFAGLAGSGEGETQIKISGAEIAFQGGGVAEGGGGVGEFFLREEAHAELEVAIDGIGIELEKTAE